MDSKLQATADVVCSSAAQHSSGSSVVEFANLRDGQMWGRRSEKHVEESAIILRDKVPPFWQGSKMADMRLQQEGGKCLPFGRS